MHNQFSKRYYLAILIAAVVVNWPIFFSDVLVNDDLTLVTSNLQEQYSGLKDAYMSLGKPSGYYFHRILASFTPDGTFAYRIYNFVLIALTGMIFFKIVHQAWSLNKNTALITTLGFLCFPSIGIQEFAIGTVHFASYLLFYCGIWLSYSYWRGNSGIGRFLGACLCVGIGVRMSSTIPFMYVFLFSFLLVELINRATIADYKRGNLIKGLWISLILTMVMLFTFTIERLFYQQHVWFGGTYNQLQFDFGLLLQAMWRGVDSAFAEKFISVFTVSGARLTIVVVVSLILLSLVIKYSATRPHSHAKDRTSHWFLLLMMVLTVCVAVFPYAMVDKIPKSEGYQSRWAILIGVSGGIAIGWVFELARVARVQTLQYAGYAVSFFLCCGFTLSVWDHYGKWQKVSHDNKAIIAKLKQLEFRPEIHVWCIENNLKSEEFYLRRWYDWAYIFDESWDTNRETMGFGLDYCQKRNMYQSNSVIKPELSHIEIIESSLDDLKDLTSWMYHGKARPRYNMGSIRITANDTRIQQLSGAQMVIETVKFRWFSSELLHSYYDNISVSYL